MNSSRRLLPANILLAVIFFLCCYAYRSNSEFSNLKILSDIESERSRLLADELNEIKYEFSFKPTYSEGYRDAIIRMGTPTQPGSYRDGYYAAFIALGDASYADGYHAAISQYNFPDKPLPPIPPVQVKK